MNWKHLACIALLAACGGNDRGVCVSTAGNGVDDEANESTTLADGTKFCEDFSSRTGCKRLNGEFTEGAEAADTCPDQGFEYECESEMAFLEDAADCPEGEDSDSR